MSRAPGMPSRSEQALTALARTWAQAPNTSEHSVSVNYITQVIILQGKAASVGGARAIRDGETGRAIRLMKKHTARAGR
jgi:hypothetical protein